VSEVSTILLFFICVAAANVFSSSAVMDRGKVTHSVARRLDSKNLKGRHEVAVLGFVDSIH